ncbi:MAG: S41 family peptidase [Saprospiraceae bacterium]
MKKQLPHFLLLLLALGWLTSLAAQDAINAEFKSSTIEQLSQLLNDHYVFPEVAEKTGAHLRRQLKAGAFDKINDVKAFADALTTEVQSVNHDKHMRVRPAPAMQGDPEGPPEKMLENQLLRLARQQTDMAGFREAKRLDGNIGYLDLRGFAGRLRGAPVADRYMGLLAGSDAIIIDLRKNGGGDPAMVQYLCSYFFEEKTHLNSLYWREGDRTEEFWTLDAVGGEKMPDVPLFVLTSNFTFSGAEEFSYNMQTRKRATLVGETTGGGANPGGMFPVNADLAVFIPTGRAINPVTQTNWEGKGVVPDVKTTAEEALNKAIELAADAAAKYRAAMAQARKNLTGDLMEQLSKVKPGVSEEPLFEQLKNCCATGLLDEMGINGMGYAYLMEFKKPETAEAIFKCNTRLFPESANVYDSYAETLLANGKKAEAVANYKKAVSVAEANGDPNTDMFRANLKAAENKAAIKRP